MAKKPWAEFQNIRSKNFVADQLSTAIDITPEILMDMSTYRKNERVLACGGSDPIKTLVAYAQDELSYSHSGEIISMSDRAEYLALRRERKLNKFGLAYRPDAKLLLHKTLADIVVGAAIFLYQSQGWSMTIYDGLRTVDGAYNLYLYAPPGDMESGLLSMPGESAHNKGLAVDSMFYDAEGKEIDMGAHFDHLDMEINSRLYDGDAVSALAKRNRRLREAAFVRAAFAQNRIVAPLRNEFWDDRLPENRADLWRVIDSVSRCIGISLLSTEDEKLRKNDRAAFAQKWENWSYEDFLTRWRETFAGHEIALEEAIGTVMPPTLEKPEFYHGNFNPIYDSALLASGKHLTEKIIPSIKDKA